MLRFVLLLLPWVFLGGCTSVVVGVNRLPEVMTIGFEGVFQALWEPVAGFGLAVAGISLYPTIRVLVYGERDDPARAVLAGTRFHPVACLVLVGAGVVAYASHLAHEEAVRRSNEWQAASLADLHDEPPPRPGPVMFHQAWRQTARLSLTLYLVSCFFYLGWIVTRAWVAFLRWDRMDRSIAETFS